MYWSKATNPIAGQFSIPTKQRQQRSHEAPVRIPAFKEFPMIKVVQPAYHCLPNGGQGSFCPSDNLRLSCVLVLATVAHVSIQVIESRLTRVHQIVHSAGYVIAA